MLSGAISVLYRGFGIKRSPRYPNICTRCSTHVEERRLVEIPVLFADLSSLAELTQDFGAEKTHEVVDAFLRMATDVWVKHGAFIDKYVGDAVMALFNVPLRQEDHAQRAIAAATELNSASKDLGAHFNLALQASTAIGDVMNLAARLQSKAGAGEILISEESYGKSPQAFPEAKAEQATLKGFRDPVRAYRLHSNAGARLLDDAPDYWCSQR